MMRNITIILLIPAALFSAGLETYRGTPLLCMSVMDNKLPAGEYSLVRSYRNITQLLVSTHMKVILYTDRDNTKDSDIQISAYNLFENRKLEAQTLTQHEFNLSVERLIKKGDTSAETIPFPGGDRFIEETAAMSKPEIKDGEYYIFLKKNDLAVSLMTVNIFWKKLTLRNVEKRGGVHSSFYSVYIDECYDKNIKKIIREYAAILKKHSS